MIPNRNYLDKDVVKEKLLNQGFSLEKITDEGLYRCHDDLFDPKKSQSPKL